MMSGEWSGKRALIDVRGRSRNEERMERMKNANLKQFLIIIKVTIPSVEIVRERDENLKRT
jgi:hypothetical protein